LRTTNPAAARGYTSRKVAFIEGNIIRRNTRYGCTGGGGGGGIYLGVPGTTIIRKNVIESNGVSDAYGGGIFLGGDGSPRIEDNLIRFNTAGKGGGLAISNGTDADIIQNVVAGNAGSYVGGIYWLIPVGGRGPWLFSNTIATTREPGWPCRRVGQGVGSTT
jgi:parallel beta-helix repeat protein